MESNESNTELAIASYISDLNGVRNAVESDANIN